MTNFQFYESRVFCFIWHSIALTQFSYAIYFDNYILEIPQDIESIRFLSSYGGKGKFLTYWCLIIQALYFTIALLNDLVGSNDVAPKRTPLIRKIKDFVFSTFAWPVAWNVAITFWALYAVDRELVFPKALDTFFPNWLNHVLHTNIVIFITLELCVSFRKYPTRKAGLLALGLFNASYLVWIHIIYHKSGVWVYPFLEVLGLPQRILFFAAALTFAVFLYRFGEFVNSVIWVKELKQIKGRKSN